MQTATTTESGETADVQAAAATANSSISLEANEVGREMVQTGTVLATLAFALTLLML